MQPWPLDKNNNTTETLAMLKRSLFPLWLLTNGFRLACCQAFEMYVVFGVRDVNGFSHISVFHFRV